MNAPRLNCPSAPAVVGTGVVGVVAPDGRVRLLDTRVDADGALVDAAPTHVRFAAPCRGGACGQWARDRCSVIDRVLVEVRAANLPMAGEVPACWLRTDCRWFAQHGVDACRACPLVVTRVE